ncbi:MAG: TOBE domain-containing protein [Halopseudomonas sp.]|uniref:TOBE domain-containing protein n=1 Tax=Halopseudomonas sp. TaxID=2901191 RepID=UPI00300371C6
MKLEGQLWFAHEGRNLAGQARIELLQQIALTGSISQAARAAGMSYKTAWDAVDAMNKATGAPLVQRSVGGKGGGGTRLTAAGEQLVAAFERYQQEHQAFISRLAEDQSLEPYLQVMNRLRLRTSARNQLYARVTQVEAQGLNDRIALQLDGGQQLVALVTHASTERLDLRPGVEVFALIKAPWVRLAPPQPTLNRLEGEIIHLAKGKQGAELHVQLLEGPLLIALVTDDQVLQGVGQSVTLWVEPEQIILCAV